MLRNCLACAMAFLAASPAAAVAPAPVEAEHAIVVTAQHLASSVGAEVLRQGGNVVDAAVAVGYALAVVYPAAGNLGGGGFMTIRFADGRSTFVDFREKAPGAATPTMFLDGQGRVVEGRSTETWLAVGVPGSVAGLEWARGHYGSKSRATLIAPAVALARDGFTLAPADTTLLDLGAETFAGDPETAAIFTHDGKPYAVGDRLVQRQLAATLEAISAEGADAFYKGRIGATIALASRRAGGLLTEADLATYAVRELEPIRCSYRGYDIVSAPPPSAGGVAICEILNILEGYDLGVLGFHSAASVHLMVEAMRRAFHDRQGLGDPAFVPNATAALTEKAYAAKLRSGIDATKATSSASLDAAPAALREGQQTTQFSVADAAGNAVSVTYTLNSWFGLGRVAGDTGVLMNNEMDDFAAKPDASNLYGLVGSAANAAAPGKTPLSSMSPTIVSKNGKLAMVLGSPGALAHHHDRARNHPQRRRPWHEHRRSDRRPTVAHAMEARRRGDGALRALGRHRTPPRNGRLYVQGKAALGPGSRHRDQHLHPGRRPRRPGDTVSRATARAFGALRSERRPRPRGIRGRFLIRGVRIEEDPMTEPRRRAKPQGTIEPLATLPVFLKLRGKKAVIAGGTPPAVWKAELLAAAGASVQVFAIDPCVEMRDLADAMAETVTLDLRSWHPADLDGAAVAIGAFEGDAGVPFREAARAAGVPVNIIDVSLLCDFQFGTIVTRSPLAIGISTDGAAPVFGQALRARIEALLPAEIGAWAQAAQDWRGPLQEMQLSFAARRRFWELFADRALEDGDRTPSEGDRDACMAAALDAEQRRTGRLILVGASHGGIEHMTLQAVRALQSADVILYDPGVPSSMLMLGRREARRTATNVQEVKMLLGAPVEVGKTLAWIGPGDPATCPKWLDRQNTLRQAGLQFDIVPSLGCIPVAPCCRVS